ncbi:hypothetical protein K461DRAFT_289591 [Myriangium duriaei CBS 260.36]|uniref:Uncharacterized protein n=1 Tax=Myriangium duriaei CBS 260.36 TaxID=1168546 RepID=A0A9P4MS76_9PEZI|nr:hypothetical protein K461DRAFT_289591 [Myriangium duriaei CBS 260.36]
MRSFITSAILVALAATGIMAAELNARDTVAAEHRPAFDKHMSQITDDHYHGYFYNKDHVWVKIHDADTHDVVSEEKFKHNGKAPEFLKQTGMHPRSLTPNGPVGSEGVPAPNRGFSLAARSPLSSCPVVKRDANPFEKRASRCGQFCARSHSCTADARCPSCRYVGGACQHQLSCQRR